MEPLPHAAGSGDISSLSLNAMSCAPAPLLGEQRDAQCMGLGGTGSPGFSPCLLSLAPQTQRQASKGARLRCPDPGWGTRHFHLPRALPPDRSRLQSLQTHSAAAPSPIILALDQLGAPASTVRWVVWLKQNDPRTKRGESLLACGAASHRGQPQPSSRSPGL